jgi:pimeloyl-ACP methyl ester carboxylesterase
MRNKGCRVNILHKLDILKTVLATLIALGLTASASAESYEIIATTSSRDSPLVRTEYLIQAGTHPLSKFKMVRLTKDVPTENLKESILLLPHFGATFTYWEVRNGDNGYGSSTAEFFALRGYDVYGLGLRTEGIPHGVCEEGILPCDIMATWDMQSILEDIAFVRSQIEALHPGSGVVIGGNSLGAMLAIATVNAHPEDYDGLFAYSGMLYSENPEVQFLNMGYCSALEDEIVGGTYFSVTGGSIIKEVAISSKAIPDALTANPLFPPGFTNHQAFVLLSSMPPTPGPLSLPVPGIIIANGNFMTDEFYYASEARYYEIAIRLNAYVTTPLARDLVCSLGGVDKQHIENIEEFTGPVLFLGAEFGFGPYLQDQVDQFTGSSDRTLLVEPNFGHVDHYLSAKHQQYYENPILTWMKTVVF